MPKTQPFDEHLDLYEAWFVENRYVYESELEAVRHFVPQEGEKMEVGVGSGLFAAPLGIRKGVEPSAVMAAKARERGIEVVEGVAEDLPFEENAFDLVLMVTTICFVDDPLQAVREVQRVLRSGGAFVLAFVDKESPVGKVYQAMKEKSLFYRPATFFSTGELLDLIRQCGMKVDGIVQTVFGQLPDIREKQPFREGYGEGSFVVIRAVKT